MPQWSHSINFFKTAVDKSNVGAKTIFDSFDRKLKVGETDPDISGYYTTFHPICLAYDNSYSVLDSLRSSKSGKTLGVVQLIDQLSSTNAREWDVAVQGVYNSKTPKYQGLFPNHRIPFQTGKVDARARAVKNLMTEMGTDAGLATIKTKVSTFLDLLTAAMVLQKNQLINIDLAITAIDVARDAASVAAFGIYGGFVTKFSANPKLMEDYFPIDLLQSISQSSYTGKLIFQVPKRLLHRKLDSTKQSLKYSYVGTNVAHAYFTNSLNKTPAPGTVVFIIQPNTMGECTPEEMGYTDDKRYLHIVNTGVEPANIVIDIMVAN